jgi:endonuclease/exonuclease/phosphatase family metal-dependent hydrolase
MLACVSGTASGSGPAFVVGTVSGGETTSGSGPHTDRRQATTLRILAYNIHHGAGNDEVLDLERIARLIRELEPDLVALQEIDNRTERTGGVAQAAELGRMTGMGSVFGPFMDYRGGEYGMAVLSDLPFVNPTNHLLPEGAEPRSSLAIRVQLPDGAGELIFAGIHFYRTAEERMAQARRLLHLLEPEDVPVILAGDFNSTPDSEVMALIGETFVVPDKGADHFTFRSDRPEREIDFVVYRPADRFTVVESRVIDEPVASDHRPLLLVVEFR